MAFFVITGIGLIILYSVQNTATTAVTGLTANQSGNITNLFVSLTGSYLLLPIVGIVLVASMIVGGFFLFIRPQ